MQNLLVLLGVNVLSAGILFVIAALISRTTKRPVLAYFVWLVVLVRLVMPPILPLPVIPGLFAPPSGPTTGTMNQLTITGTPNNTATTATPANQGGNNAWWPALSTDQLLLGAALVWAGSVVLVLGLALRRISRFHRLFASSTTAEISLQERADRLATQLGLKQSPGIKLLGGRVPPMLWSNLSRAVIVFPAEFFASLSAKEQDALIAHELAHFVRKDHWVRHFELVVTSLFWWYPVTWWARRALRRAEEECCDMRVLRSLPGCARAYAESLCKAVEFLVDDSAAMPAAATGIGEARTLKRRLLMIMKSHTPRRLPIWAVGLGMAIALASLVVYPSMAGKDVIPTVEKPIPAEPTTISLELKDAKLWDVLYLIAKKAGINIVVDAGVDNGPVTVQFKEVEWKKAISLVTRISGLEAIINDDMVRITTHATLASEQRNKLSVSEHEFIGEPIALELKDANLDDVLLTFQKITGHQFVMQPGARGTVTAMLSNMPWDRALSLILRSNGLEYTLDDQLILVFRAGDPTAEAETRDLANHRPPTK